MFSGNVQVIGKQIVDAKLIAAAPRILTQNVLMVKAMLDYIKPIVVAQTPVGPGHFGYHTRDRITGDVKEKELAAVGVLKSPPAGYWREFGTKGRSRKRRSALHVKARPLLESFGGEGERAFMTAHHASAGARKLIKARFYNGAAYWWRK